MSGGIANQYYPQDPKEHNRRLFTRIHADLASDDSAVFTHAANKLTKFLSRIDAYYPEAHSQVSFSESLPVFLLDLTTLDSAKSSGTALVQQGLMLLPDWNCVDSSGDPDPPFQLFCPLSLQSTVPEEP